MEERPLTRQDLEPALAAAVAQLEAHTDQRSERTETRLLSAFQAWARGMEIRVRNNATITLGADERLSLLEERVSRIERGEK